MACGWNLWAWLQCIGVASPCCCKKVYRYPHKIINFLYIYTPLVYIRSFFGSSIQTSLFIFLMFLRSCFCYFFTIYSV